MNTSAAIFNTRRRGISLILVGMFLGMCLSSFGSGVRTAHAAFSGEPASQGIIDSVCFFPRRLADVDAGQGGAITRANTVTGWTAVTTVTIRSAEVGDEPHQKVLPAQDLTGAALTSWSNYVDTKVLPAIKARYRLP